MTDRSQDRAEMLAAAKAKLGNGPQATKKRSGPAPSRVLAAAAAIAAGVGLTGAIANASNPGSSAPPTQIVVEPPAVTVEVAESSAGVPAEVTVVQSAAPAKATVIDAAPVAESTGS